MVLAVIYNFLLLIYIYLIDRRLSALTDAFASKKRDDSLSRSISGVSSESRSQKSQLTIDKRSSWSEDSAVGLDNFRPVTLTVSSFFKQVTIAMLL